MIITNSVIKVKKKFPDKDSIKKYLYQFIENHPFRIYNQSIAEKYGDSYFSMTFISPDIVVLTQRYEKMEEYNNCLELRNDVVEKLRPYVNYYKISEPFEVYYD